MPENNESNEALEPLEPNIELRSEEVQEILSYIPNWIIRWGITIIFATIFALILASWFIKYPDKISSRVTITTYTPPAQVMGRSTGKLALFVADKQLVQQGDLLGVIENPAETEDVLFLDKLLDSFAVSKVLQSTNISLDTNDSLALGRLQGPLLAFQKSIDEYNRFYEYAFQEKQIEALRLTIEQRQSRSVQLSKQLQLAKEAGALDKRRYLDDSLLYKQGAGTKVQMNLSKNTMIGSMRDVESMNTSMIDNSILISDLRTQINEISLRQKEEESKLKNNIEENYEQLRSQYIAWEQEFFLRAAVSGHVTFSKYWSNNQFVNIGDEVMTIVPESGEIFGQMLTPVIGSGKVETGQRVNIKFDNYPANEYGMVIGKVESISDVPREEKYTIKVSLPNGLTSTYKKNLGFKQEMQGEASIITRDLRLLERVFNQLRSLVDNAS